MEYLIKPYIQVLGCMALALQVFKLALRHDSKLFVVLVFILLCGLTLAAILVVLKP